MAKILIVDDERSIRQTLKEILVFEKYEIDEAKDGEEALSKLRQSPFDLVLCDIKMPKIDGMEVLQSARQAHILTPFIMISAHGTIDIAVESTKLGAFDFIQKPPDLNRLLISIRNALEQKVLKQTVRQLATHIKQTQPEIIGNSSALTEALNISKKVAASDAKVLITGENGTGKELIARYIHKNSKRSTESFVEVNCAAIPSDLIESELFGHEKGAFTSAIKQRVGKFELANGGTLFLDEIGDMSLAAQAKVLKAIEERKISRVGGEKEMQVDVRLIAATNKNLPLLIEKGEFREDLYHRIAVVVVHVPDLKSRKEDIPTLVAYYLKKIALEYGEREKTIDNQALDYLKNRTYTGNIRELRNIVERLHILSGEHIDLDTIKKYC